VNRSPFLSTAREFDTIIQSIGEALDHLGEIVEVGEWQSLQRSDHPMTKTLELEDVSFEWIDIPRTKLELQAAVEPNMPWAEDHFQERIAGKPLNPGEQYKNWPWYKQGVEDHKSQGQFSHTYMERYWAGSEVAPDFKQFYEKDGRLDLHHGLRFPYGNLSNLISLLMTRPYTRQAYLPVWFPEDLYASDVKGERVPCTLGYHFLRRGDVLKVVYYMRSCDWYRYFRDDVYLTCRLLQHIARVVGATELKLVMHISSLHIFEPEIDRLREDVKSWQ